MGHYAANLLGTLPVPDSSSLCDKQTKVTTTEPYPEQLSITTIYTSYIISNIQSHLQVGLLFIKFLHQNYICIYCFSSQ
jgi:hypothetical protein